MKTKTKFFWGGVLALALGLGAIGVVGNLSQAQEVGATSKSVELCVSYGATIAYADDSTHDYTISDLAGGTTTMTLGYKGVYRQSKTNTYFQMNQKTGYLHNTVAFPGKITSIVTTWSNTKGATKCYFATSAVATSSDSKVTVTAATSMTYTAPTGGTYSWFCIDTSTGTGSSQMSSCVVNYESTSTEPSASVDPGLTSTHHLQNGNFHLAATASNFSPDPTFTWALATNDYVDLLSGSETGATAVTSFTGASAYFKPKAVSSSPVTGTLTVTNGTQTVGPLTISLTIDTVTCSSVSWAGAPNTNYLVNTLLEKANAGTITATLSDGTTVTDFDQMSVQVKAPGAAEYADVAEPYTFPDVPGSYMLRLGYLGTYSTGKTFLVADDEGTPAQALAVLKAAYGSTPSNNDAIVGTYHLTGVVSAAPTSATKTFSVADDNSGTNAAKIYYSSSSSSISWGAFSYSDAIVGANMGIKGSLLYFSGAELTNSTVESLYSYTSLAYVAGSLDTATYTAGSTFDPIGAQFTVGYTSDHASKTVEWTASDHTGLSHDKTEALTLTDPTVAEDQNVTFTYAENGISKTAVVTIHVNPLSHYLVVASTAAVNENSNSTLALTKYGYTTAAQITVTTSDSTIATGAIVSDALQVNGLAAGSATLHIAISEGTASDSADVAVTVNAAAFTLPSTASISKSVASYSVDYTVANFSDDLIVDLSNALTTEQSSYCSIVVNAPVSGSGTIVVTPTGKAGSTSISFTAMATNKTIDKTIALTFVNDYQAITSMSGLVLGQKYTFANAAKGDAMGAFNSSYMSAVTATFSGTSFPVTTENVVAFTLVPGSASGSFAFAIDSGFIANDSTTTLTIATTVDAKASWNLTYDSTDGWTIANVNDASSKLQFNAGSPRFKSYTSNQTAPEIYSAGEMNTLAETWAEDFLINLSCDSTGVSAPTFATGSSWASISAAPSDIAAAQILKAFEAGKYNLASGSSIGDAISAYDYILTKYGTTHYADNLGRGLSTYSSNGASRVGATTGDTLAIASVASLAVIGLLTTSGVFLLKKKHQ